MLKKFQHNKDIAKVSNFDYGLWVSKKDMPLLSKVTYQLFLDCVAE